MNRKHHRIGALAIVIAAGAAALALAGPTVNTGWIYVNGAGTAGTVRFTGQGWLRGSINGGHPSIEVRTSGTPVVVGLGGRSRRVAANSDVRFALVPREQFGVLFPGTTLQVTLRGPDIAETISGAGTVTFTGRGTYSSGYSQQVRAWPKTALTLRQPKATALHRTVHTSKDADSTTVA